MYVLPHHQRCVAGTSFVLSWQQIGGDGEPADPGTVTITVTRAIGTAIATAQATGGAGTTARTYTLTAAQTASLDRLTATWTASGVTLATTEIDVVAAPWFSNAELRTAHPSLANAATYAPALITVARLQAEAFIERHTHRRFVPGYSYQTVAGSGRTGLVLPHTDLRRVRSAALYSDLAATATETLTEPELAAIPMSGPGVATRTCATWSARWVKIGYEHGLSTPTRDAVRAGMLLTRHFATEAPSGIDMRSQASSLPAGQVGTVPSASGPSGIAEVDQMIMAYRFVEAVIA